MSEKPQYKPLHYRSAVITGTDTDVGKTVVTAALGVALQKQGLRLGVMKPVETGVTQSLTDDGSRLQKLLGGNHSGDVLSLYQFTEPIAPLAASRVAHQPIDFDRINKRYQELSRNCDLVLVEGAGGVMVPLTEKHTVRDLISLLKLPCIIVNRPTLGAVNHTLLTLQALADRKIEVLAVLLNESSPFLMSDNEQIQIKSTIQLIKEFSETPVVGPVAFESLLNTDWEQGVRKLANDPAIALLTEMVMGKG